MKMRKGLKKKAKGSVGKRNEEHHLSGDSRLQLVIILEVGTEYKLRQFV